MVRLSDDALAEFFSRYVTGALDLYLQAKRGVQTLAAYNPLTQLPMAATDALTRMWMGSPFAPTPYPQYPGYTAPPPPPETDEARPRPPSEPGADPRADDVAAMRRELDELKQALRESLPRQRKKRRG